MCIFVQLVHRIYFNALKYSNINLPYVFHLKEKFLICHYGLKHMLYLLLLP